MELAIRKGVCERLAALSLHCLFDRRSLQGSILLGQRYVGRWLREILRTYIREMCHQYVLGRAPLVEITAICMVWLITLELSCVHALHCIYWKKSL